MGDDFRDSALEYHRLPKPGKLAVVATKPLANQRDLALAYSPGRRRRLRGDRRRPAPRPPTVTGRANLVAVITNGTAVLGLGAIGPLAAKPVMEGKAVLFKNFAGIDVFDIEIDERDPDKLVDIIASLEPTFGGINLEDIKAPECFEIERRLRERLKIPVFHDDQHGTAIIVAAAIRNGLKVVGKDLEAGEAGGVGRRRGGARLPRPAGRRSGCRSRTSRHRHRRRGLSGPQGGDGPEQGPLCQGHQGAHAGRGDRRAPTSSSGCRRRAC